MGHWSKAVASAAVSGTVASLVSTAALAALARYERKGALQPTNSTSHWLHGKSAARVRQLDFPHTGIGFATHHASAIFWAIPFERWLASRPPRNPAQMLLEAIGMSAIAAAVDYGIAPKRATPGWEEVLSPRSIAASYGALAVGLAAGALVTQAARLPRRADQQASGRAVHREGFSMGHVQRRGDSAKEIYDVIRDIRICMMTTSDKEGRLFSRPMYALSPDEAGDLWFFTRISSPKVREFGPSGHVNLAFSHPGKQTYASVSGHAELVDDKALIEQKWAEPMRTWFPGGKDDPELALVRVRAERGEYWDSPSSAVVHLYGYVKASLTGEPPKELTEAKKVDLR